jgi:hypothetical protein
VRGHEAGGHRLGQLRRADVGVDVEEVHQRRREHAGELRLERAEVCGARGAVRDLDQQIGRTIGGRVRAVIVRDVDDAGDRGEHAARP